MDGESCRNCKNRIEHSGVRKMHNKFPYVLYPNMLLLTMQLFVVIWWLFDKCLFDLKNTVIPSHVIESTVVLAGIIIIVVVTIIYLYSKNKKTEENKKSKNYFLSQPQNTFENS